MCRAENLGCRWEGGVACVSVYMGGGDVGVACDPCSHFLAHSFGRCVNSDVRSDQCHILEPTELLRVSHNVT